MAGPKEATKAHACSVMLAGRTRTPSLPLSFGGVTLKFIIPGSLLLSFLRRHEQLAKLQHFNVDSDSTRRPSANLTLQDIS